MNKPILSIVVPVLNESKNIIPLVDEIEHALGQLGRFEIIYIDDGSQDDSATVLRVLSSQRASLRVVTHEFSYGQSRAVHSGVLAANSDWIATLDGDGQNDPADIVLLWKKLQTYPHDSKEVQVLAGHRQHRYDTWLKRLSSKAANAIRRSVLNDDTPDTGCGLKLFPRKAFLSLPYFDHMHRFLPALFIRQGYQVTSVTVNHRKRQAGRSHYGFLDRLIVGIPDLLGVLWLIKRQKLPLIKK